jgi:signal transduction histidine kinase
MLKFRVKQFPESSKKIIKKDSLYEVQLDDELLNKFNLFYAILLNPSFFDSIEGFIVIALEEKPKELSKNETEFLEKVRIHFDKALNKEIITERKLKDTKKLLTQNENLREQDRLRTNFINNISHEFRTPLSSILGFSKMLITKNNLTGPTKEIAQQIQHAAGRLSSLITDFLQINRITTEGWLAHFEACDLGEVIKCSAEEFSSLNKNYKISYKVSDNYPIIKTDPKLTRQVIDNLISNAIKYSPPGSTIKINLEVPENKKEISVTVRDEGIGIPKDEIPKIFNRLYRSTSPEVQRIPGSGLGLTICKEIILSLGGKIHVESESGKGSKFTFTLPISN